MRRMGLFVCTTASQARLQAMKRFIRYFVMWLLVLALPVQGFAASTMLLCDAGHQGSASRIEAVHDHGSHGHNGKHEGAQPVRATSEPNADVDALAADSSHVDSTASPKSAKHAKVVGKCGSCASCCTAAFLPTTIAEFKASTPSRAIAVVELTTRVGFFTDGPDRPPRLRLA